MTRIAFDTNILAYLVGVSRTTSDDAKILQSRDVLARLAGRASLIAPAQTLGELCVVLNRAGVPRDEARDTILKLRHTFAGADTTDTTLISALDLSVAHRLQIWDAIILNAAAESGCAILLSEDMQDGFLWQGVTVVNPLKIDIHPRLGEVLNG